MTPIDEMIAPQPHEIFRCSCSCRPTPRAHRQHHRRLGRPHCPRAPVGPCPCRRPSASVPRLCTGPCCGCGHDEEARRGTGAVPRRWHQRQKAACHRMSGAVGPAYRHTHAGVPCRLPAYRHTAGDRRSAMLAGGRRTACRRTWGGRRTSGGSRRSETGVGHGRRTWREGGRRSSHRRRHRRDEV